MHDDRTIGGLPKAPAANNEASPKPQSSPANPDQARAASSAKAEAARRNGALSRGPITPEGKARSARNGFRHGLTAQNFLTTPAEEDAFRHHFNALIELWDPQTSCEHYLVEKLARADFQHDRAERTIFAMVDVETDIIAPEIQRAFQTIDETGALILGYKSMDDHSAAHRNLDRHIARLSRERIRAREAIL